MLRDVALIWTGRLSDQSAGRAAALTAAINPAKSLQFRAGARRFQKRSANWQILCAAAKLAAGNGPHEYQLMWCSTCQQETPGVAHATSGRIVCSRCQQPMPKRYSTHTTRICDEGLALDEPQLAATTASRTTPFRTDEWAAGQRVRKAVRELRRPNPTTATSPNRIASDRRRFDPPHDLFGELEHATVPGLAAMTSPLAANTILQYRRPEGSQIVAWLIVIAGMLALSMRCRPHRLVNFDRSNAILELRAGSALGGQGTLIFGLVLVISRLWRSSRYAAAKLQEVYARIGQLQQSTETLATMRSGGAPAFYADLVRGASPHVMLANLKGQVDQLASRVGSAW